MPKNFLTPARFNDAQFQPPIFKFLPRSLPDLIKDVATTTFNIDNEISSCAFIDLHPNAAWVILHESIDHFGIEAENFGDEVVTEVLTHR